MCNDAASAADFHSSQKNQHWRDVSTPFQHHFRKPAPVVSELYRRAAPVVCAATDSAIIELAGQGPRGSPLYP